MAVATRQSRTALALAAVSSRRTAAMLGSGYQHERRRAL